MHKKVLDISELQIAAKKFCDRESGFYRSELFGVTDGKAVGTFVEHQFQKYLEQQYEMTVGSSANGLDLPSVNTDIKVTSIKQPQSSCPFKDSKQKIYGLGYNLIVFVYQKFDDTQVKKGYLNFLSCTFIESSRTADYQTTTGILNIIANSGNTDDIFAFLVDHKIPSDEVSLMNMAEDILRNPPKIGYLTISNALQWRLQYSRIVNLPESIDGITQIVKHLDKNDCRMNVSSPISDTFSPKEKGIIREDYGDWQTSYEFAKSVCLYLKSRGVTPEVIVEPTCGVGNFITAAIDVFDTIQKVYGVEIVKGHICQTEQRLQDYRNRNRIVYYKLYNTTVFAFDFKEIARENTNKSILVLGNPPWVTNSNLGKNNSTNLPAKGNIDKTRGIEAITGKGNFDIAESICNLVIDAFSDHNNTHIAMLVKSSVIKNILYRQHFHPRRIQDIRQLCFDAKKEFKVSVSASLFECHIGGDCQKQCLLYDFYSKKYSHKFGWVHEAFVSHIQDYEQTCFLDGQSPLIWRSGIKHDCAKVMELSLKDTLYYNGLKEIVDIDDKTIFPLLKSSDIGRGIKGVRKYLVLPQTNISEDTSILKKRASKTYSYLLSHAVHLDARKSIIYRNKPRFSVFGLGDYSFAPYKVVISSLYPDLIFSLVKPIAGKPVMVDDTCYLLGFKDLEYAKLTLFILQSELLKRFIRNISFKGTKRIINKDLLMRIDLYKLSMTIDYKGVDIAQEKIIEYQNWLYLQTQLSLFDY